MIPLRYSVASLGILFCVSASSEAATITAGFETGSYASTGLSDFSSITAPTLVAAGGASGSTGLDFGSDGASGGGFQTIPATGTFSMMGRYNGNAATSSGTMGFGWSKASAAFNPFNGTGTGVFATDHLTLAVARGAGNTFSLAAGTGVTSAMSAATFFGNTVASLTSGNWYRLEGTILFDAATETFTFNSVSLDDFGATGATEVTPDLLAGTGRVVIATGFGTTAQPMFLTNRDRGFQVTDNYFFVPEPGTATLLLGASLLLAGRRRRVSGERSKRLTQTSRSNKQPARSR